MVDVLPAPLGPRNAMTSPGRMVRSTPLDGLDRPEGLVHVSKTDCGRLANTLP